MCDCWSSYAAGIATYAVLATGLFAYCLRLVLPERTYFVIMTLFSIATVGAKLAARSASNYISSALTKSVVSDPNDIPACSMRKPRTVDVPEFSPIAEENSHVPEPEPQPVPEEKPVI